MHGSPIGNPPPLLETYIQRRLSSANLHTHIIFKEISDETATGRMPEPCTIAQAYTISTATAVRPLWALSEKEPGGGNWHMIRHLSKQDADGLSTNGWLYSDDFPTMFYSAVMITAYVSTFICSGLGAPCANLAVGLPCITGRLPDPRLAVCLFCAFGHLPVCVHGYLPDFVWPSA